MKEVNFYLIENDEKSIEILENELNKLNEVNAIIVSDDDSQKYECPECGRPIDLEFKDIECPKCGKLLLPMSVMYD